MFKNKPYTEPMKGKIMKEDKKLLMLVVYNFYDELEEAFEFI